jgi:hypothetical protein
MRRRILIRKSIGAIAVAFSLLVTSHRWQSGSDSLITDRQSLARQRASATQMPNCPLSLPAVRGKCVRSLAPTPLSFWSNGRFDLGQLE